MEKLFNSKRSLFPWGFTNTLTIEVELAKGQLAEVLRDFIEQLLPEEVFTEGSFMDLKGREPQEILYVSGEIEHPVEEKEEEEDAEPERSEFWIRIDSVFERSEGPHHFVFKSVTEHSGAPDKPIADILSDETVTIHEFRIGLFYFKSRRFSSLLGFAPVVVDRLLIDGDSNRIQIKLISEGVKRKDSQPLADRGVLDKIEKILG